MIRSPRTRRSRRNYSFTLYNFSVVYLNAAVWNRLIIYTFRFSHHFSARLLFLYYVYLYYDIYTLYRWREIRAAAIAISNLCWFSRFLFSLYYSFLYRHQMMLLLPDSLRIHSVIIIILLQSRVKFLWKRSTVGLLTALTNKMCKCIAVLIKFLLQTTMNYRDQATAVR